MSTADSTIALGAVQIDKAGYVRVDLQGLSKTGPVYAEISDLLVTSETPDLTITCVEDNESNRFYWGRQFFLRNGGFFLRTPLCWTVDSIVRPMINFNPPSILKSWMDTKRGEPDTHPAVRPFKSALMEDGIPFTSFGVDDVQREYERLSAQGVQFTQKPPDAGSVMTAVFDDTCGNLIQIAAVKEH